MVQEVIAKGEKESSPLTIRIFELGSFFLHPYNFLPAPPQCYA